MIDLAKYPTLAGNSDAPLTKATHPPSADTEHPDLAFRDFEVDGVPESGFHHPYCGDYEVWAIRLGLNPLHLIGRDGRPLMDKSELRAACMEWLEADL